MNDWTLIHSTLAFFALAMSIVSLWAKRSPWIWGSFLVLAFALAYLAKIIAPVALIPIGALLVLHTLLKGDIRGLARFILVAIAFVISMGLTLHKFPGFDNIPILQKVQVSPGAPPFSLWLNFDKPFIGLFVLALGFPLIANLRDFGRAMRLAIPLTIAGLVILITFALSSDLIRFDPKLPGIFWFFAIVNLIFVAIIEEAFWRGFIQREFFRWFGEKGLIAAIVSILLTALLFTGAHILFTGNLSFLIFVFLAGIIYGSIFHVTKALEASILCHWVFNITHFLLFTYPYLALSSSS